MTDLSPEACRLLGLARRGDDPLDSDRARLDRRMSQRLALAAGVTGVTLGSAKVASGAALATLIGKGVATGVVVTATAFGLWKAADHVNLWHSAAPAQSGMHSAPAPSESLATANRLPPNTSASARATPAAQEAHLPAVPPVPVVATTRQPNRDTIPTHTEATTYNPSDPLEDEVTALREAQQAISVGQAERALALIALQNQRFGAGSLRQERAAARVFALCHLGRQSEARSEAHAFELRWPKSPMIARVRRACDAEAPK